MCHRKPVLLLLLLLLALICRSLAATSLIATSAVITLTNDYIFVTFDRTLPSIRELRAATPLHQLRSTDGGGTVFGANLLSAEGVGLEFQPWSQWGAQPSLSGVGPRRTSPIDFKILANTSSLVAVEIGSVTAGVGVEVSSTWTLSLDAGALGVNVSVAATVVKSVPRATAVRVGVYTTLKSAYAIYNDGVLQQMNSMKPYYGAGDDSTLERFYALGGGGAVDLTVTNGAATAKGDSGSNTSGWKLPAQPKQAVVYALGGFGIYFQSIV